MKTAKKILMVRPAHFTFNEQTAENNYFQKKTSQSNLNEKALKEFDNFVTILRSNKIEVVVVQDTADPHTPDSIYPNNWFSTHPTGELVLYPMFAENRRLERKSKVIKTIKENFSANKVIDLTAWENKNQFLEGTGSLLLDHNNLIAYACRSQRTDEKVFEDFCTKMNFKPLIFNAYDQNKKIIYHTNVMLSIGEKFAVICAESIIDDKSRNTVLNSLKNSKKEVIEISFEQMNNFCANILELRDSGNKRYLVMSDVARKSFTDKQTEILERYCKIVSAPLPIIEETGGGSARCMIAQLF